MSLKQLVNTPAIYEAFLEHLDEQIAAQHKVLETSADQTLLFKAQGAIAVLKRMKQLRESVNGKHS